MPTLKLCTDCNTEKETSLFSSAGQGGGRLRPQCKECTKKREVSRYESRRAAEKEIPATRVCTKCNCEKKLDTENFKRLISHKYGFANECRSCSSKRCTEWKKTDAGKALVRRLAPRYAHLAREYAKRYRHMRRAAGEFSYDVVPELMKQQNGKCAVCRGLLTKFVEVDHIYPVSLGGTNERSNLQLLCRPCNRSKGAKHPVDFMQSRGYLL